MHIVSASRRTDIPAFHSDWFMNRIRSGSVLVRSPFNRRLSRVSLRPEDVCAIVFWTKDAAPLLPHLDELVRRGYCFTFLYTVNNYPRFLEPRVPDRSHTLRVLDEIAGRFSSSVLRWRYDTIVLTGRTGRRWHLRNFRSLCESMAPYSRECIFSFCDYYRKTVRNMDRSASDYRIPDPVESRELVERMADLAADHGVTLASCSHDFLVSDKVRKARCIDSEFLGHVVDTQARQEVLERLQPAASRKGCGCTESRDIGAYNTCAHGCVYCYANSNPQVAMNNAAAIEPQHPCLEPGHVHAPNG